MYFDQVHFPYLPLQLLPTPSSISYPIQLVSFQLKIDNQFNSFCAAHILLGMELSAGE